MKMPTNDSAPIDEPHAGSDSAAADEDGPQADSAQDEGTRATTTTLPSTEELYRGIYGPDPGFICLVSMLRGKDGKVRPEDITQRFYQYPTEFGEAMARIALWSGGPDEYLCAHLLSKKRREKDAALPIWALYADIDDAPIPVGDLRPSVLIESSPGRYQGFWFSDRALDPTVAEPLNQRLTIAIGADPSGFDLPQILRPPGSVNHKRKTPFTVRLVEADMHTVDPDELDRILPPLPTKASGKPRTKAEAGTANETPSDDGPVEPPVRLDGDALRCWRGELHKTRDGRVDRSRSLEAIAYHLAWANASYAAICDALEERDASLGWHKYTGRPEEYSKSADEAVYAVEHKMGPPQDEYDEPTEESPGTPGEEQAETPRADPVERVDVDVSHGDLNRVGARVLAAMDKGNEPERIFVGPTGEIARIVRSVEDTAIIQALTEHVLRYEAQRMVRPTKPGTGTIKIPVETALPLDVVRNMSAREAFPFPPVQRVVNHPIFGDRSFDSFRVDAGYSPAARAYVSPDPGFSLPQPISRNPSRDEIAWAVEGMVDEWLFDFPFVGDADRAHAVAYFLLPFVRNLIEGATPHHLFDAPGAGTGKGLLQSELSSPAKGRGGAASMAQPETDDEMRKKITSALMRGETHFVLGNVSRTIDSASLSEAMTTPVWTDRILGGNTTITAPVHLIWASTGNNIALSPEQARRSVRIRMDAETDRPFERTGFKHPLPAWSTEHRGDLVWAALTMTSAWIAAGCPAGNRTLGSFEDWASVMGGILDVAGIHGFLGNSEDLYATADSESDRWRALLTAWLEVYGTKTVTTAMIFGLPPVAGLFDFRSDHVDGQRKELGHEVAAKRDHTFGDLRIVGHGNNRLGLKVYSLAHKDGKPRDPTPSTTWSVREEDQINPFDQPPAYAA